MEQERSASGRDNAGKRWSSLLISRWPLRYGMAVVAVAATFGLRLALTAWEGPGLPTYITFYPAVMVSALLAGFGPGLLATALTMGVTAIWILPPEGPAVGLAVDILGLVLFASMGLFMSTVAALYRRNRLKVATYERELALRKSQEALRESEERFSKVFHEAPVGLSLSRAGTGVFSDVNSTFLEITGFQREEAIGHTTSELDLVPDLIYRELLLKELREHGGYRNKDFRIRRKDGESRDLIVNAQMLTMGDDQYILGMMSDITEHKRAEEAVRESEERLKRAEEIAHLGSWDLDLVKNRLTWSDEVYHLFGLAPQEFGATFEAFLERVHPEDRAAVDAAYSSSLRENRDRYEIEHRVVRKDTGEIRTVHEKCEHHRDATGRIICSVGMVHDITERKRAEEALRKAHDELEARVRERTAELARSGEAVKAERQRFNDVLEMLPAYVLLLTPDYHVVFDNRIFRERFGDHHGRRCFDYLFGLRKPCENCETFKALKTNSPHRWEWTGPDGRNYDIYDFPFTDTDGSRLVLEMGIDITERKKAEAALIQAEKALVEAKRLSDIGALAASVAHELRNPLGVIQMAAYNLRRKSGDPALERHLANIEKKVLESDQIINNLLGYSRIKIPNYEAVSIPDLVNECLADTANRFQNHNVAIDKDLKEVQGETIEVDPVQIKEVLNNLLANAYQALEEKQGRIQIRGTRTPEGGVEINIQDNGSGIEKEDLVKVFNPFFTRKSKGTGLGLSLSHELVRLHGGRIAIESEKGQGTTVAVILPRKGKAP
jgi:PAS domain S-box-containing protein